MRQQTHIALSAVTGDSRTPPDAFRIFPFGSFQTEKGTFSLSRADALKIVAAWSAKDTQPYIDYEHQVTTGGISPAAGWFSVAVRQDGLWATNIKWTQRAADFLKAGEYRYFSPLFGVDKANKTAVVSLENVALTNLPAMHGIAPLVAAKARRVAVRNDSPVGAKGQIKMSLDPKLVSEIMAIIEQKLGEAGKAADEAPVEAALAAPVKMDEEPVKAAAEPAAPGAPSSGDLPTGDDPLDKFDADVRSLLGLDDMASEDEVLGAIQALLDGSTDAAALKVQLSAAEHTAKVAARESLISDGLRIKAISLSDADSLRASDKSDGYVKAYIDGRKRTVPTRVVQANATVATKNDAGVDRILAQLRGESVRPL